MGTVIETVGGSMFLVLVGVSLKVKVGTTVEGRLPEVILTLSR
jgi:hypothetical protein